MIDQRVWIGTRDVRHIAAWIADVPQPDATYRTGRYRPICGAHATVTWPPAGRSPRLLFAADQTNGDARWAYPLCQRCVREAAIIAAAATS